MDHIERYAIGVPGGVPEMPEGAFSRLKKIEATTPSAYPYTMAVILQQAAHIIEGKGFAVMLIVQEPGEGLPGRIQQIYSPPGSRNPDPMPAIFQHVRYIVIAKAAGFVGIMLIGKEIAGL